MSLVFGLFQILCIFPLFDKQSTGFLSFLLLLTTLALQDHSKDGLSLYICSRLSLKALFVAKVPPRFLQAGKSTLVNEFADPGKIFRPAKKNRAPRTLPTSRDPRQLDYIFKIENITLQGLGSRISVSRKQLENSQPKQYYIYIHFCTFEYSNNVI